MPKAAPEGPVAAFQGSMIEVELEDVLGSMLVKPERGPKDYGDHRLN